MSKTVKILGGGVLAIILVIVVVMLIALQNLDSIIKNVIETVGSDVTQTEVTVSEVKFTLKDGRGEIRGLKIANPPGYQSSHAFSMKEVAVELDPTSLTGDVFVIKEILIDGADLIAEQKGSTTNLNELLDNMNSGEATSESTSNDESSASDVRLVLEKFAFTGTAATLTSPQLGEKALSIPDIRLRDIGDKETGLTPEQLATSMVKALLKQVEAAVTVEIKKMAKVAAQDALEKNLSADDKAKLDDVKSLFKKD